jgi:hypothetical protein
MKRAFLFGLGSFLIVGVSAGLYALLRQQDISHQDITSAILGLISNETVRTSTGGQAELQFLDRTKMSVGPMSTVRLDKFAYDPNRGTGNVVVNATRGAYRFITGVQDPRSYEIKTPYATLGVRGTVLELVIQEPVRTGQRQRAKP